jgi:GH15 family glucan-1,4-alpha-glucosidase
VIYRPISAYALIGDTRSAALITSDGSLDWLCFPRFDSPAMFLRLLDADKGGYCLVQPAGDFKTSRSYMGDSAVLQTVFTTERGSTTVTDFMPVSPKPGTGRHGVDKDAPHRVVRLVRCEGDVECRIEVKVTPNWARLQPTILRRDPHRFLVLNPGDNLHIQVPSGCSPDQGVISGNVHMRTGQEFALVLTWSEADQDAPEVSLQQAHHQLRETLDYWHTWAAELLYRGDHAHLVKRSAITLKLLTYEPTGAIIAAPTTSLPETVGGHRNWDYRYTWFRDSSLTLSALMNLGNFQEAHDFFHFLHRNLPGNAAQFRIMYRIDGDDELAERNLPLAGYRGSRPVRVGNGAAGQTQLDIYGELMHCMFLYFSHDELSGRVESFERNFWPLAQSTADFVAENWRKPGNGMWEMRGKQRQFTHSIAMCWVALDRAIQLARRFSISVDTSRWETEKRNIMEAIETHGYHPIRGAYVESFSGSALDASLLRLPLMGVLDAKSDRFSHTIRVIESELMERGLVYRYSQDETDDGVGGREGTFSACAFWLVEVYVLQGRLDEAEREFDRVISHANDLGLMSEELDAVTSEQLGNFPQGFTHIGLTNAACRIAAARGKMPDSTYLILGGESGKTQRVA